MLLERTSWLSYRRLKRATGFPRLTAAGRIEKRDKGECRAEGPGAAVNAKRPADVDMNDARVAESKPLGECLG